MSSPRSDSDKGDEEACPFLLKLFYRTGSIIRPEDFAARHPPPHVEVYTHKYCTLTELAAHLTALLPPSLLPSPPIGTRLVFQLVYPDIRNPNPHQRRYLAKDLGSVVIGGDPDEEGIGAAGTNDDDRTLADAKFVVGDFVSCVVLPPLEDGSVAPVSFAKREKHPVRENGRLGGSAGPGPSFGVSAPFPAGDWRRGERVPPAPTRPRGGGRRR
ncbi:hypothetical protein VUR80DRAFT_1699 [Thermomyces stellatus]